MVEGGVLLFCFHKLHKINPSFLLQLVAITRDIQTYEEMAEAADSQLSDGGLDEQEDNAASQQTPYFTLLLTIYLVNKFL